MPNERWVPLVVAISGLEHRGRYMVRGGFVHVSTTTGSKETQIGGTPVVVLAEILLRQLVSEGNV